MAEILFSVHAGMVVACALLLPTSLYTNMPISPLGICTQYPPVVSDTLSKGQWPLPLIHCDISPLPTRGTTPRDYDIIPGSAPIRKLYYHDQGLLFSFIFFYSPNAYNLCLVFQILSSFTVLLTWERAVQIQKAFRMRKMRRSISYLAWACSICKVFEFIISIHYFFWSYRSYDLDRYQLVLFCSSWG